MSTGVGPRASATLSAALLLSAGLALGGLLGGQDSVLRQGNSAWGPDPPWPSPEGPRLRDTGPLDNPWTSPHPAPWEPRSKALDVQTLTNIVNVARYILCECTVSRTKPLGGAMGPLRRPLYDRSGTVVTLRKSYQLAGITVPFN